MVEVVPVRPQARGLVVAGYGSARAAVRSGVLDPLADALARGLATDGPVLVRQAFTGERVRALTGVPGVSDALASLAAKGVAYVAVASIHLVDGRSQRIARTEALAAAPRFRGLALARPLIDGLRDARALAAALSERHPSRRGVAFALVGHGAEGRGSAAYGLVARALADLGREDMTVALLHAPAAPPAGCVSGPRGLADVLGGVSEVVLVPLMLGAGSHVARELDGPENSWRSVLLGEGYGVEIFGEGTGCLPVVRELAERHLREALARVGPSNKD